MSERVADSKHGSIWSTQELDTIVADYFEMLGNELAGRSYVKSHHSAGLMKLLGRSHRSVEFKHQNISAVLDELGLPWIPGYIPKRNYQAAIFDAIDRYLSGRDLPYQQAATIMLHTEEGDEHGVFIDAPGLAPAKQ